MENSMEFSIFPWNSMEKYNEKIPSNVSEKNHGIPWNSMEFNGIPCKFPWNFPFHGIPWKIQ
jgi:hypothetical protein